jgi:GH24 family phage-related lysozyme (muramidase)
VLRNGLHVAYRDSKGIATIGYGFNLQDAAAPTVLRRVTTKTTAALIAKTEFLTEAEAQALLLTAEGIAIKGVSGYFPRFGSIDLPRRVVLASMGYQFGEVRFGKFRRLIPAVNALDWGTVVIAMQESRWYRSDSPLRAHRMVVAMQTDTFPASAVRSRPGRAPIVLPSPGARDAPPSGDAPPPAPRRPWPFDNS